MNLFQSGDFTLHSGDKSDWKIECNAFTKDDWQTIANMIRKRYHGFKSIVGVPRGGLPLANLLQDHLNPDSRHHLIVDDVYTTGNSMEKQRDEILLKEEWILPTERVHERVHGIVVFARRGIQRDHSWIIPIFQTTYDFQE